MMEILKEEMKKSLKEIYKKANKQWKEMNRTVQDLKVEIEPKKETPDWEKSGNEELRDCGRSPMASLTHRVQEVEERLHRRNGYFSQRKCQSKKNNLTQSIQKIWDAVKDEI